MLICINMLSHMVTHIVKYRSSTIYLIMSFYPFTNEWPSCPMTRNPFPIYNKCIEMRLSSRLIHLITCSISIAVLIYAVIIYPIIIGIHIHRATNITITYV